MKILQTPVRFYPYIGGVENYVFDLSKELVKLGHNVTVVCANEPKSEQNKSAVEGISVKRLNYIGKIANTNISLTLPVRLLKENFDILHTHFPTPWSSDWSAIISLIKRKPLVITYHNDIENHSTMRMLAGIYNKFFLKFVLKTAKKIIIDQPDYLKYSKFLKRYKTKVIVVPIGIDINKFKPHKCKKIRNMIFFLGILDKFHRYKGLDYLIKSVALVKKKIPDIKLVVGGKGELVDEYKQLVKRLRLEKNVDFIGYVDDKTLVKLYSRSQIFILPSISNFEGFGIVLLEAMACKTPVICTDLVGMAKNVENNRAGIVIRPKDTKALGGAIIEILTNEKIAKDMRENALRLAKEKYDSRKMALDIEKIYEAVK